MKASKPYIDTLKVLYRNPSRALDYLNSTLESGDIEDFLLALRDMAEIHGISKLSTAAKLNRPHLYKILSRHGHPEVETLRAILKPLGYRLAVLPAKKAA